MCRYFCARLCFFFGNTAPTEVYTLPYTTLFRSGPSAPVRRPFLFGSFQSRSRPLPPRRSRSEEHTSELQSRGHLVCRLPPEKQNTSLYSTSCAQLLTTPCHLPDQREPAISCPPP